MSDNNVFTGVFGETAPSVADLQGDDMASSGIDDSIKDTELYEETDDIVQKEPEEDEPDKSVDDKTADEKDSSKADTKSKKPKENEDEVDKEAEEAKKLEKQANLDKALKAERGRAKAERKKAKALQAENDAIKADLKTMQDKIVSQKALIKPADFKEMSKDDLDALKFDDPSAYTDYYVKKLQHERTIEKYETEQERQKYAYQAQEAKMKAIIDNSDKYLRDNYSQLFENDTYNKELTDFAISIGFGVNDLSRLTDPSTCFLVQDEKGQSYIEPLGDGAVSVIKALKIV